MWQWLFPRQSAPLMVTPLTIAPEPSNRISTTKYHPVLFLPATLVMQFTRIANVYFLATAVIQCIPGLSALEPFTAILPLSFVLVVSLIRESVEEWAKYRFDKEVNAVECDVWVQNAWVRLRSEELRVGMVCRIHDQEIFPADMVALKTAKPEGVLYLQTSGLDGEKALKNRYVSRLFQDMEINQYSRLQLTLSPPNSSLYLFQAETTIDGGSPSLLNLKSFLYRGCKLKNSDHVLGVIVYVGAHTKVMLNSCKPQNKMSTLEGRVNLYIVLIFIVEVLLMTTDCVLAYFTANDSQVLLAGNTPPNVEAGLSFVGYFILLNTMIPISLIVSIEVIKSFQGYFIGHDQLMAQQRGEQTINTKAFRSSLNQELGMVDYVFTDKTGTLTRNQMVLKELLIGTRAYLTTNQAEEYSLQRVFQSAQIAQDRAMVQPLNEPIQLKEELLSQSLRISNQCELIEFFLFCMSMCHECVLNSKTVGQPADRIEYEGSSPDEIALVDTARWLGWAYQGKSFSERVVLNRGRLLRFEVLDLFEFDSDRKRMTVVLKYDDQSALVVMKGADNIVKQRLASHQYFLREADRKVEENSIKGLRTLLFSFKLVELSKYAQFHESVCNLTEKDKQLKMQLISGMESDLILLGATAVEDRLQDKVPETLRDLLRANIKVCMLTGDKLETAENIARSCHLIAPETHVIKVREHNPLNSLFQAYKETVALKGNSANISLIIEGLALPATVQNPVFHKMLELCDSIVCCRITPADKASVVRVARYVLHKRTLAIGDGANDVQMITHANLGIGIYGNEGMSAVQASDYALPQFKALWRLLFVHGRWNYMRIADMIKYFFFKNMVFTFPQFFYSFYQAYSGASLYIGIYLSLYNTIFTCIPVVIRAVLQQDVNYLHYVGQEDSYLDGPQLSTRGSSLDQPILHPKVRVNDRVRSLLPSLYLIGQQNLLFTNTEFVLVNIEALFCGALIYFTVHYAEPSSNYLLFSVEMYTCVVCLVTAKLCLQVQYWTWLLVASIFVTSLGPYIAFNVLDSLFEVSETYGSFEYIFSQPIFYLVVTVTSSVAIMLTALIDLAKRYFRPSRVDRARKQMVRQLSRKSSLRKSSSTARSAAQPIAIEMAQL